MSRFISGSSHPHTAKSANQKHSSARVISTTPFGNIQHLQRTIGNRATSQMLKPTIQREWNKTDEGKVSRYDSSNITKQLLQLIPDVNRIPTIPGTIAGGRGSGDDSARIDMQGPTSDGYANIQAQYEDGTFGGVICPFDMDMTTLQAGLTRAISEQIMLRWTPGKEEGKEEGEETEEQKYERELAEWAKQETADEPPKEPGEGKTSHWHTGKRR